MVSGKYCALTGAISREQRLANISANLANVNTVGYKKSRMCFESLLKGELQSTDAKGINYSRVRENFTEFGEGAMKTTGNPLDLAIHGNGFFKVQTSDGTQYTRRGDFHVGQDGTLLTGNDMPVLDEGNAPIIIPNTDTSKISVNSLGEVSILSTEGGRESVGKIAVYSFNDTKLLKRETDTLFSLNAGAQENLSEQPRLAVGTLETSNVNMTAEMALMIDCSRTFESCQKVLKTYAQLGQKQDELGTIG